MSLYKPVFTASIISNGGSFVKYATLESAKTPRVRRELVQNREGRLREQRPNRGPPPSARKPTRRLRAESSGIPAIAQFSALRAGNGAVAGIPELAQRVGFEPTVPVRVHLISSQGRYNHFDTAA